MESWLSFVNKITYWFLYTYIGYMLHKCIVLSTIPYFECIIKPVCDWNSIINFINSKFVSWSAQFLKTITISCRKYWLKKERICNQNQLWTNLIKAKDKFELFIFITIIVYVNTHCKKKNKYDALIRHSSKHAVDWDTFKIQLLERTFSIL